MDLRRIRHFTVLAQTLNFSRAAERLHIAQPALSVSIQKLESELGTRLFERTPSGVRLTDSGQAALVDARRLLYHGEQLTRAARDATAGTTGRLRIGFVGSAVYGLIPTLVPAFRAEYPDVELVLREDTSARIVQRLEEETLDIGLVRTPLMQPTTLELLPLQQDRFIAALPRSHPLAAAPRLSLAAFADEPFVLYTAADASGLHSAAMAACQSAGFVPQVAQQAIQVPTVLALVASGLGVALVPEVVRGFLGEKVTYRDLDDQTAAPPTALALAWNAALESPAGERFIRLARGLANGHASTHGDEAGAA